MSGGGRMEGGMVKGREGGCAATDSGVAWGNSREGMEVALEMGGGECNGGVEAKGRRGVTRGEA